MMLPKRAALKQSSPEGLPPVGEALEPRRPLSLPGLTRAERSRSKAGVSRGKA